MLQKENEWKEKMAQQESTHTETVDQLKKDLEQAQLDKQLIGKSYEQ